MTCVAARSRRGQRSNAALKLVAEASEFYDDPRLDVLASQKMSSGGSRPARSPCNGLLEC